MYGPVAADGFRKEPECIQGTAAMRNAEFGLRIAPTPFTNSAIVSYSLAVAGNVSLKLYDITGKLVSVLAQGYRPAGSYACSLLPIHHSLALGVYLLKYETAGFRKTQKLVVE